jgi:hypothetical protein
MGTSRYTDGVTVRPMKYADTRAALDLHDEAAVSGHSSGADGSAAPGATTERRALPDSVVLVHALLRPMAGPKLEQWELLASDHPVFLDAHEQLRAACGLRMKVVLPFGFDQQDDDICHHCRVEVARWAWNPELWWREQTRWEQRKRARDEESESVAVWRALQDRKRTWEERGWQEK